VNFRGLPCPSKNDCSSKKNRTLGEKCNKYRKENNVSCDIPYVPKESEGKKAVSYGVEKFPVFTVFIEPIREEAVEGIGKANNDASNGDKSE